jgi:hypothetical protein
MVMWLVFSESAYSPNAALREEFFSLRSIELLDGKISHWLVIPVTALFVNSKP